MLGRIFSIMAILGSGLWNQLPISLHPHWYKDHPPLDLRRSGFMTPGHNCYFGCTSPQHHHTAACMYQGLFFSCAAREPQLHQRIRGESNLEEHLETRKGITVVKALHTAGCHRQGAADLFNGAICTVPSLNFTRPWA